MIIIAFIVPTLLCPCEKSERPEPKQSLSKLESATIKDSVKNQLRIIKKETIYYRQIMQITELIKYLRELNRLELAVALKTIPHIHTLLTYSQEPIAIYFIDTPTQKHKLIFTWNKNMEIAALSALLCELASIKNADESHFEVIRFLVSRGATYWGDDDTDPVRKALLAGNMDIFHLLAKYKKA